MQRIDTSLHDSDFIFIVQGPSPILVMHFIHLSIGPTLIFFPFIFIGNYFHVLSIMCEYIYILYVVWFYLHRFFLS